MGRETIEDRPRGGRFPGESCRRFAADVFIGCGVPEEDAMQAADVLCTADEWGISSHGLARLRAYYDMLKAGHINPRPRPRVVRESPVTAVFDGDNGLGLVVAPKINRLAIEKAEAAGTAWVAVFHSNHFGIAGYYAQQALSRDMIGWTMTNTPALVSPLWGVGRVLGTNPLAVAIPTHSEPPVVIDMATSAISFGVAENALRRGQPLPDGCIADRQGEVANDPEELFSGGALLPLGGDRLHGGHKGYCLASLIDILCGVLVGANWGPFVPSFPKDLNPPSPPVGKGIGHLFGAFQVGAFTDVEDFKRRMDQWISVLRSTPSAPGCPAVQIPGDPERRAAAESAAKGILLCDAVIEDLRGLARRVALRFD